MADNRTLLDWSFVLTLAGGIVILVGGIAAALMMSWGGSRHGGGMMEPWQPSQGWFTVMALWMVFWGVVSGAVVIVAAARLRARPEDASVWGTVAIIAGALSLLAMGGYLVGALAAIAGGALALSARGGPASARATG